MAGAGRRQRADAARLAGGGEIAPTPAVWVRAPVADVAQDCAWLALAGASARPIHGSSVPAKRDGILVELLPERLPPIEWNGPRVSCIPDGPDKPQWSLSEIHVTSHLRHSIVEAVALAQRERPSAELPATEADGTMAMAGQAGRTLVCGGWGCGCWVAEDNPVNRNLLVRQRGAGLQVTLCADGRWRAGALTNSTCWSRT